MSAAQLALFDDAPPSAYPHRPGFKAHGAAQDAARRLSEDASRLRIAVLDELRTWPQGRTADELAKLLQRSPLSVRPRLSELKAMAKIVATGERRRNESGMTATVWRAA
jgi:hypothetical protein